MKRIIIPDNALPADLVGETDLLPGQDWLEKETLLAYASMMQQGRFPWEEHQEEQPMAVEVGINGKVITQGHHRWLAARLAEIELPPMLYHYDYIEAGLNIPFAYTWAQVTWRKPRR